MARPYRWGLTSLSPWAGGPFVYMTRAACTHCYVSRHELELLAPRAVVGLAAECSRAVRMMRDAVSAGARLDSDELEELTRRYLDLRSEAQDAMRSDIWADNGEE
ncbi:MULTISPECIES: hypothetical protein [Streptomyces]|uniref:Uncharacterized protein n=1 Tax=Streptomyces gibsoniae TaxID=3075529 RepID=A0ABU2U6E3_9ACTN|nr:hypothetical protein [Streptomyces sp. DSM 41699]MDT0468776.1 hypothetical protein [Streptomyces sp. DSM 41699]